MKKFFLPLLGSILLVLATQAQNLNQIRQRQTETNLFALTLRQENPKWNFDGFSKNIDPQSGAFARQNKRPTSADLKGDILQSVLYLQRKNAEGLPDSELNEIKARVYQALAYWLTDRPQFRWTDSAIDQPRYLGVVLLSLQPFFAQDQNNPAFADKIRTIRQQASEYIRFSWNFGKGDQRFLSTGEVMTEDVQRMGNVGYRLFGLGSIATAIEDFGALDTLAMIASKQFGFHLNTPKYHPHALMADYSLHQHNYGGGQIYNLGYGLDWFNSFVSYAHYMDQSPWQLDSEHLIRLAKFLEQGIYPLFISADQVVMQATGRHNQLPEFYSEFPTERAKLLRSMLGPNSEEGKRITAILHDAKFEHNTGYRAYYTSDLLLAKNSNYAASVRMVSARTSGQESGDENQQNALANFFFSDGSFLLYDPKRDLGMGAWDWRLVPGTTTPQISLPLPFVPYGKGYDSHNTYAGILETSSGVLGSFYLDRSHPKATAKGNKSYALLENLIFFHGNNLAESSGAKLITTIDQTEFREEVVLYRGQEEEVLSFGEKNFDVKEPIALYHDGLGYIIWPIQGQTLKLSVNIEPKKTQWNVLDSRNTLEEKELTIFQLLIDHGKGGNLTSTGYNYLILPTSTPEVLKDKYNSGDFQGGSLNFRLLSQTMDQVSFEAEGAAYFVNYHQNAKSRLLVEGNELEIKGSLSGRVSLTNKELELNLAQMNKPDTGGANFEIRSSSAVNLQVNGQDYLKNPITLANSSKEIKGNTAPKVTEELGKTFTLSLKLDQ
ncbi:polysaccharide lyase family 8 super-sandwich domain-containing protein [Algoriphagus namhaensis]